MEKKYKLKCKLCGTVFDPHYSKSDIKAMKNGYSISMRCVNRKCDNYLYGSSHANKDIRPNQQNQ